MEEEKKLYPMKICSIQDKYQWGEEEFKIADLGYRDSLIKEGWLAGNSMGEIMDMYMDRVVGDNVFEFYGRQFPFEIKYLRVNGKMPLRVHPDDEVAEQRYDFLGKEKMWYVAKAGKDAKLYLGFAKDTTADELCSACADGSVEKLLNVQVPHEGDHFHIAPGTVHAASGDIVIVEVSESSPLDFCLCSWGQELSEEEFDESLTMVDALDFIDYKKYSAEACHCHHHEEVVHKMVQLPQFTASKLELTDSLHIYTEQFDSFMVYTCLKGVASVQTNIDSVTLNYTLNEGETILVPAECPDFFLVPQMKGTDLLEVIVEKREDPDPYINPDVSDHLEDDDDDDCCCGHHHEHDILS